MKQTVVRFKVVFLTGNTGFSFFYRGLFPLRVLAKWGFVEWKLVKYQDGDNAIFEALEWADIVILQYVSDSHFIKSLAKLFKDERVPKVLMAEFDDDFSNIHPSNMGAYQSFGTREIKGQNYWIWKDGVNGFDSKTNADRIAKMFEAVGECDSITVTNLNLAKVFRPYNINTNIIQNFISPEHMQVHDRLYLSEGRVIIGWQGGDSHYDDLAITMPALKSIKDQYGDRVQFIFMGAAFLSLYKQVDGLFIPWTKPERFYNRYNYYLPDIALAPLLNNDFNQCKSSIKFYEAAYYGIPIVAANVIPYKEDIIHGQTGYLYDRLDQCRDILSKLINDSLLRKKVGGEAKRWVEKNRNIEIEAYLWYNLFVKEFDRKLELLANTTACTSNS